MHNDQRDAINAEHDTDGTHSDITATTVAVSGISSLSDHIDVVDAKSIRDGNNNELVTFSQTASAENEFTIANAADSNGPELQATGDDTNIDIELVPKGTGQLKVGGNPIQHGAWTTWTTNITGFSDGAIDYAKYCQIGKTIHYRLKYTGTCNGAVGFDLPVAEHADYQDTSVTGMGQIRIRDAGTTIYTGSVVYASAGKVTTFADVADSTYLKSFTALSGTVPMTWGSSDMLYAWGTYEAA
jgi:hypothetical protein